MKHFIFCATLLLFFHNVTFCKEFGYISYSTTNVGDDFQAIAAKQFLPPDAIPIDREFIHEFQYTSQLKTLVNGWFMHHKDTWYLNEEAPAQSWPPSRDINPLFISFHITPTFLPIIFSEENIQYLIDHGPIGARDSFTLNELQKRGIPSYFSGCLTLTLMNDKTTRNNTICLVDVDQEIVDFVKSRTNSPIVEMTHARKLLTVLDPELRLKYAQHMLDQYKTAKCVITTRLHATLPCLAFETPVLMIPTNTSNTLSERFEGLVNHAWHCSKRDLLDGAYVYDFDNPPTNPGTHLEIRNRLISQMESWVNSQ